MDRLENAVQELRNDFDTMAPSIVKLVAVEKDIQELVSQLETLVSGENSVPALEAEALDDPSYSAPGPAAMGGADAAPVPLQNEPVIDRAPAVPPTAAATPVPSPLPATTTAQAPPAPLVPTPAPAAAQPVPAPVAGAPAVTAIRIGEHPGKTRIVLDLSAKTDFTADLDNAEKILVIELPNAGWSAAMQKAFSSSPLLISYDVTAANGGKGSLLALKLKADASILYKDSMPADSGSGHKIVIDIGAGAGSAVSTQ
jgi:hypothetical protein